jgi:hypothetical protein
MENGQRKNVGEDVNLLEWIATRPHFCRPVFALNFDLIRS